MEKGKDKSEEITEERKGHEIDPLGLHICDLRALDRQPILEDVFIHLILAVH